MNGSDAARDSSVGDARARRRASRARGVTGRLVVAVVLPVVTLAIGGAALLQQRYQTAQRAASIEREVPSLNRLATLRQLLEQERVPTEGWLRAKQFGFDIPNISALLGFSNESLPQARLAVNAALPPLGPLVPPGFATGLAAVRRGIDSGRLGGSPADTAYERLDAELSAAFDARLAGLQGRIAGLTGSAALQAALGSLSAANDALSAGISEEAQVSIIELPGAHPPSQLSLLGEDVALLSEAGQRLHDAGGEIAVLWSRFQDSPGERGYAPLVRGALNGRVSPAAATSSFESLVRLSQTFRSGVEGSNQLYPIVSAAEAQVRDRAVALRNQNTSGFRLLLAELLIAAGLTIGVALLLARSITGPLRVLEARARAVSDGDLAALVPTARGPKETVVVSEAFNDLVNNLRLMEAQTRALSECAFDDPVLSEPLPGRLGRALHESVEVLSGSVMERDALQQRLVHQATHDSLTSLHNRAATVEFLEQALARAQRSGAPLAALFIDLDDFKRANDTHGHGVGDAILKEIAQRLNAAARRGDFLARLGGDEFLVIAEGLEDPSEATALGERLLEAMTATMQVQAVTVSLGVSVGVAFALQDAADEPSQLLARADLAVHRAKQAGSGRVEVYDESLQGALIAQAAVEQDLHVALDAGGDGLFLLFQPVVDARTGAMRSVEALVRWERRGHGLCQPGDFIPVAEQSDLIIRLDCWVLATALEQLSRWSDAAYAELSIAVNISGRHLLSGELSEHVRAAVEAARIEPARLILEVTETVLLADMALVARELERLRSLGIRVAIDDFGTGYTSLAHLQRLVVDELKIDRSFVEQLSAGESPLVRMVTELGHQLGVSVVAEGIETDEQLSLLREIGCDALQGFFIGRPLTLELLESWRATRDAVQRAA